MTLRNCTYDIVAKWMEMDRTWCCVVFQHGVDLMGQLVHNILFHSVCKLVVVGQGFQLAIRVSYKW
jgi:hypothetical protein